MTDNWQDCQLGKKSCCQLWQYLPFQDYFDKHVKEDIIQCAGTWYLRMINVPEPHKGSTTNRSESLNHMMNCFRRDLSYDKKYKPTWGESIILAKVCAEHMDKDIYTGNYGLEPYKVDKTNFPNAAKDQAKMRLHLSKSFKEHTKVFNELVAKMTEFKCSKSCQETLDMMFNFGS